MGNLFSYRGDLNYEKYRKLFKSTMKRLELSSDHKAHDPRATFITLAKKYKLDEYAIKYIVGHSINDSTENVYTNRDANWLVEEMQKIK